MKTKKNFKETKQMKLTREQECEDLKFKRREIRRMIQKNYSTSDRSGELMTIILGIGLIILILGVSLKSWFGVVGGLGLLIWLGWVSYEN